jgi:5'-phosphate synthase pdxT subunit
VEPVGILALQGSGASHAAVLEAEGVPCRMVRHAGHLDDLGALVLPGGESTTMLHLLAHLGMRERLADAVRDLVARERPVLATCAGLILLASRVTGPAQESLGLLDVDVVRNAYGRQLASGTFPLRGEDGFPDAEGLFIRAPAIRRVGAGVSVLARRGEDPVLVAQGSLLAATFHPEAHPDAPPYRWFLARCRT